MAEFDSQLHVRSDDRTKFKALVGGEGTAGTPDAGVVTVQGIIAGTPLRVTIANPDDQNPDGLPQDTVRKSNSDVAAAVGIGLAATSPVAVVTITAAKLGYLRSVIVSASGLGKFEILAGATFGAALPIAPPVFTNPADLTKQVVFATPIPVAGGIGIFIKGTNRDKVAQDLYAMIDAYETV